MRPEFWKRAGEVLGRLPGISYIFIFFLCLLAASALRVPLFTIGLLIAGGFISLLILSARIASDVRLQLIVLGSYGMRVILSLALYYISLLQIPIFSSIQAGDGFWAFSPDSAYYHLVATEFVSAWQQGTELRDQLGIDHYLVIGGIYRVLGPHPLYPVFVNIWLVSVAGILAYLIGKQLSEERAGITAAFLVSFWPSSLVWSSQILKDSLVWFLILLVIQLMLTVIQPGKSRARLYMINGAVQWMVMFMAVLLLSRYRYYMGVSILLPVLLLLTPMAFFSLVRGKPLRALELVSVICLVSLSVVVASTLDPLRLVSPRLPSFPSTAGRDLPPSALPSTAGRDLPPSALPSTAGRDLPPPAAVGGVRNVWELFARGLSRLQDGVSLVAGRVSLRMLIHIRSGFLSTGGNSLVGPEISDSNFPGLFRNIPRIIVTGLFAPFPWQWFRMGGSVDFLQPLYSLEMLLFYFLFPAFLFSAWRSIRGGHGPGVFLILFILIATLALSIAVANLGTLSRLRLPVLIVILILTSSENPLRFYKKIWKKIFKDPYPRANLEE